MNRPFPAIGAALVCLTLCAADGPATPTPARTAPRSTQSNAPKAVDADSSGQVRSRTTADNAPHLSPEPTPAAALAPAPAVASKPAASAVAGLWSPTPNDFKSVSSVALIGLVSLTPAVILMFTSFVRINIVLILLRQALGSPQVPGNQVLTALAILLSALVMQPVAESVYTQAIQPYARNQITAMAAWDAGTTPIKVFMVHQIDRTDHLDYLWDLYEIAEPPHPGQVKPKYPQDFPLRAVAPAFLISELTTALMIGFLIYLPFLVVDLVVSAVLSAMGLFMLPPSLVAMPLKLILFVLADGWMLVASALLRTFAV